MKTHSKQAERTKSFLKSAFVELVHEKGYSAVTVKDIVKRADYNRTTFYLYYQDKFDLVDELYKEMSENIVHFSISKYKLEEAMAVEDMQTDSFELLYFIYDQRQYFKLLLVADTIPHIHRQIPDAIYHVLDKYFEIRYSCDNVEDKQQKRYMAYGTTGVIIDWVEGNFKQSPAEITQQLIQILLSFAKGFKINPES